MAVARGFALAFVVAGGMMHQVVPLAPRRGRARAMVAAAVAACSASAALLFPIREARAVDYIWVGGAGGTFSLPVNWAGGPAGTRPDDASDNAIFDLSHALGYTVTFTGSATNGTARIRSDKLTFNLNANTYTAALSMGDVVGKVGTLTLSGAGGTMNSGASTIGGAIDAVSTLNVGAGVTLNFTSTATIGNNNGAGTLAITGGGDVTQSGGMTLGGSGADSFGTVTVSGVGSTLTSPTGGYTIGNAGVGAMSVVSGASVTGAAVTLANNVDSSGIATVSGVGSTWSVSSLTVGNAGVGSFTVNAGGAVSGSGAFTFGAAAGSDATGLVTGTGSTLSTTGNAVFGSAGTTSFILSGGATLSNNAGTVGSLAGGSGSVLISGSGTTWTNSGVATLGASGSADVTVESGAHVTSAALHLGQSASGSGQLTLTDTGSLWTVAGDVTVGGNGTTSGGTGTLSIQSGATLTQSSAAGVFRIHAGGTVNLDGGTLTVGALTSNGGAINFTGGTLNITAAGTALSVSPTGALGATLLLDANQTLNITNTVDVAATGLIEITGDGMLSAGTLNNAGEIRLTSELAVLNGTTLNNSGLLQGHGHVNSSLTNNAAGEIRAATASERLVLGGASITNSGTINASDGGTVEFTHLVTNNAGASINVAANSTAVFDGGLTGVGALTGAGTKYFAGGTSSPTVLATTGDTVVEAPATVTTGHVRERNLTVHGQLSITPNGTDAGTSTVETVTVASGGKFDLANNDLVVKGSTLSAVQALVASGYAGGAWNGPGINSSSAAQNAGTTLGIASNGLLKHTEFSGVTGLDLNDVLVRYTYYGDADLSGATNLDDFTMFLVGYQHAGTTWAQGDFNYSGSVTLDDFSLFLLGYQQQGAPLGEVASLINGVPMSEVERAAMLAAVQAVPEPTAFGGMILLAGCGAFARRRRRSGGCRRD